MKISLIEDLQCPACGTRYPATRIQTVCLNEACKSSLFASYNLPLNINPAALLSGRPSTMWRYHEFLPVTDPVNIVTLGEGFT
ncbi:MAG TPA: hypothetical protein VGC08_13625, partial [Pedobacter sp.]